MDKLRLVLLAFIILVANPVWCRCESPDSAADDAAQLQLLSDGRSLVNSGKPAEAITGSFDKIIANFQSKYGNSEKRIFCGRNQTETLAYLLEATTEDPNRSAIVISPVWASAYFMKGYALVELGRVSEAKSFIEQAIAFSPGNSQYLSELGYIYQIEKNWPKSLELFQKAEEAANSFSSPEEKLDDLGHARRGQGYVFVEMGRLEKAEEKYRECLKTDPNDAKAAAELGYIRDLRNKK